MAGQALSRPRQDLYDGIKWGKNLASACSPNAGKKAHKPREGSRWRKFAKLIIQKGLGSLSRTVALNLLEVSDS